MSVPFRYTFPIAKAESRDGGLYLVGEATGPELDAEFERMAPEAITRFAHQIEDSTAQGMPLVYRDAHQRDGVAIDLGVVERAAIDERFHLHVEVRLNERNPLAKYLFESIHDEQKQYGMSVAGHVIDYVDEFDTGLGMMVRTYKNVVLTEISNTTRPAWTPSFGTVLSKAIDAAAKSASVVTQGDNPVENEELVEGAVEQVESTDLNADPEDAPVAEKADEAPVEETLVETVDEPADPAKSEEDEDEDVEKAGRSISAANRQRLLESYATLTQTLRDIGVLAAEEEATPEPATPAKSDSTADAPVNHEGEETVTEKSASDRIAELERVNAELTARIGELEGRIATKTPPVLTAEKSADEQFAELLKSMSPSDKLRLGLALAHKG